MSAYHAVRSLLSPVLALGMIASFLVVAGMAKPAGTAWSNPLTASVVGSAGVDVDCPAPVQPTGADRTFNIDDSAHLMWIRDDSTRWDDTYVMVADIDMGTCVWSSPIAPAYFGGTSQFRGVFDGNGKTITNLSVAVNTKSLDDSRVDVAGFIGHLADGGQLRDTTFRNAVVTFDDTNNFDDSTLNSKVSYAAVAVAVLGEGGGMERVQVVNSSAQSTMADVALPSAGRRTSYVGGAIAYRTAGYVADVQTSGNVIRNVNSQTTGGGRIGHTGGVIGVNFPANIGNVQNLSSTDDSIFGAANNVSSAGALMGQHWDGLLSDSVVTRPTVHVVATRFAMAGGAVGGTQNPMGISGIRVVGGSVLGDGGSTGQSHAGGAIGESSGGYLIDTRITGTTVVATGTQWVNAGGVIGVAGDDTASRLFSDATVSAISSGTGLDSEVAAGGLIGYHLGPRVQSSYATGDVTAWSDDDTAYVTAGGLVGSAIGKQIDNVYSTGNATATSTGIFGTAAAGGLIGFARATVENAYSTGVPSASSAGTASIGGLLAVADGDVRTSFFNTTTSGVTTSAGAPGAVGLSSTQIQSGASPIDTWALVEGWQEQTFAGSPPLATAPFWGQCNVNSGFPFLLWQFAADPCSVDPPSPPPAVPSGPPLDVSAVAGDASVSVAWQAPASSGTFPVSTYQVQGSPSGTCVATAPAQTCEITGLTNDVAYTFEVRALTGAGWGAWSLASNAVTPQPVVSPSIVISGSRADVRGKPGIIVTGVTQGFGMGAVLRPWVRLPGQTTFTQGSARVLVDESGDVTWQRRVGKKVTVYLATPDGSVKSKRITIPKSGPQ